MTRRRGDHQKRNISVRAAASIAAALWGGLAITAPASADAPATAPASQPAVEGKPAAAPPKRDDPAARAMRTQRDSTRNRHAVLPELPTVNDLGDLVTLSEDGAGRLVAQIAALPPNAAQQMRVKVRDLEGVAFELQARGSFVARNGKPAAPVPALYRYEFDAGETSDDALWLARLNAADGYLSITGQSVNGRYSLVQNTGRLTFTYRKILNNVQAVRAQADSLRELRIRYPKEFDEYVVPLLSKFSDLPFLRPGPGDVYTVFAELPADDAATRQVLELLPQLEADSFAKRDAASRALAALGPAGVLAVMRLDADEAGPLTDEQRSRLSALVDASRRLPPRLLDPAAARGEPRFLADCLEDPDLAVRTIAKRELERVLGRAVDFDVTLPPDARAAAADAVRKTLPKPKVAATQPQAAARP